MTIHFGNVPVGSVLPVVFDTYAGATGASITLTGLAITDVEVYKGTSMTQRASDAGIVLLDTDGIDIDGITGIHGFSIDTGDDTDAGFYAVGAFCRAIVSAVTVDTQVVNFVAATWRLVAAEAVAGKPKVDVDAWLGTAAATPGTAGVPSVDAVRISTSATAADNLELAGLAYSTTRGLTGTALPAAAADAAGGVPISDAGGLDLDSKLANTNEVTAARMGALTDWINGGRLDLILDIIAADTTTDIPALIAALNNLSAAQVNTEVDTALADINLDHLVKIAVDTDFATTVHLNSVVGQLADNGTSATFDRTTDSQEAIRDRGDAAWTTGTALDAAGVRTAVGLASANLDTQLTNLPTNAELTTALGTADDAVLTAIAALNNLSAAQVNTEVDSVLSTVGLTTTITGRIDAAVSTRATPAQVNTEVLDCLVTDTYAEPGQGTPAATTSLAAKLNYLYKSWRNKKDNDGTVTNFYNDAGNVVDQKQTTAESGGTVTKGEIGTGP